MPVLYFLPWVSCSDKLIVGDLQLTPYERGVRPTDLNGIPLKDIDAILGNYGNQAYFPSTKVSEPITKATVITFGTVDSISDPPEEAIRTCLQAGQQLAFCGLAKRVFCSHFQYCNTDGYRIVAQRFRIGEGGAIAVTTRRRDGYTSQYLGDDDRGPRFVRPLHVDGRLSLDIDTALLKGLQAATDPELGDRLSSAISVFLAANTDAPEVPQRAEIVLLRIAFETLLDATHHTANLVQRFSEHFKNELPSPPVWHSGKFTEDVWRARWPKVARPLDAWVNDFCDTRNSAAHGPRGSNEAPVWPPHVHLLFASWLFPLVVKGVLASAGLYRLTEDDLALRRGFEAFLAHDVLARAEVDKPELRWSKVERSLLFPVWAKTIYS